MERKPCAIFKVDALTVIANRLSRNASDDQNRIDFFGMAVEDGLGGR